MARKDTLTVGFGSVGNMTPVADLDASTLAHLPLDGHFQDVTEHMPASIMQAVRTALTVGSDTPLVAKRNAKGTLVYVNVLDAKPDAPAAPRKTSKAQAPAAPPPVTLDADALNERMASKAQDIAQLTGMDADVLLAGMQAKYAAHITAAQQAQGDIAAQDARIADLQAQLDAAQQARQELQARLADAVAALAPLR